MFISIVCATFLLRVKPVSTRAKPACMKNTRNPPRIIHMIFKLRVISATSSPGPPSCANTGVANINISATTTSGSRIRNFFVFLIVFISHSPLQKSNFQSYAFSHTVLHTEARWSYRRGWQTKGGVPKKKGGGGG